MTLHCFALYILSTLYITILYCIVCLYCIVLSVHIVCNYCIYIESCKIPKFPHGMNKVFIYLCIYQTKGALMNYSSSHTQVKEGASDMKEVCFMPFKSVVSSEWC